eukprot:TRINITY_DN1901_c0_g1_i1.p1 TRINITY_DN1901_c0_g1~~TRINITY_DN1901_c0_g1_i1.p1  ORF type:complete len:258 (-),score=21.21 TRINITY_DN1901_c0_g1_i1:215-988(-)
MDLDNTPDLIDASRVWRLQLAEPVHSSGCCQSSLQQPPNLHPNIDIPEAGADLWDECVTSTSSHLCGHHALYYELSAESSSNERMDANDDAQSKLTVDTQCQVNQGGSGATSNNLICEVGNCHDLVVRAGVNEPDKKTDPDSTYSLDFLREASDYQLGIPPSRDNCKNGDNFFEIEFISGECSYSSVDSNFVTPKILTHIAPSHSIYAGVFDAEFYDDADSNIRSHCFNLTSIVADNYFETDDEFNYIVDHDFGIRI